MTTTDDATDDVSRHSLRIALTALFILMFSSVALGTATAQPDCGTVTYSQGVDGAQMVENVEQLQCIKENPVGEYRLRNDIDATETVDWDDEAGFEPIGVTFRGTFDGDGYVIRDLFIDRPEESEVGLFASTSHNAVVRDVTLEDAFVTGSSNVGAVVGENRGDLLDAHASGVVEGEGERNTGGLTGRNVGGDILRSSSTAEVSGGDLYIGGLVGRNSGLIDESYTDGAVEGDDSVGGVTGYNLGTVRDSYSHSEVSGRVTIGGVVGHNRGTSELITSYAAGTVRGTTEVRGLVALTSEGSDVVDSYFDTASVQRQDAPRADRQGTPLSTDEMTGDRATSSMVGFDFDETWRTVTDPDDYPVLAWQVDDRVVDDEPNGIDDEPAPADDEVTDEDTADEEDDTDEAEDDEVTDTDDDTTDEEDDTADDDVEGMPGFGFFVALAALVGVALLSRRSEEE